MDTKVTVGVKGLLVAGLVLLALVTAYLLGGSGGGGTVAQAAPAAKEPQARRTLTMVGTGKATAVPDQLSFGLSVGVTRLDLDAALDESSRVMERVLGSLTRYGVKRGDVQTTGLSMNPVYDYHPYSPPTIRGYRVTQRASVLVKQLELGGRAVSAAVAAGGNAVRVGNIRLRVGDPQAVMKKARDAAVAEATAKAAQYADAAGERLGPVLTLREVRASRPLVTAPLAYEAVDTARGVAGLKALPIRTGHDDLEVTVQVVWEFA
jgi:uncharacterized protein YggE